MARKFIINDNRITVSASVDFHYQLISDSMDKSKTVGGGWWFADPKEKRIYFYSKSEDFGRVTKEQFIAALPDSWFSSFWKKYDFYFSKAESIDDAKKYSEKIERTDPNYEPNEET